MQCKWQYEALVDMQHSDGMLFVLCYVIGKCAGASTVGIHTLDSRHASQLPATCSALSFHCLAQSAHCLANTMCGMSACAQWGQVEADAVQTPCLIHGIGGHICL
jgi:hypothetical protein